MRISRVFVGGFLFIALLVIGIFLLIRGCLARYDERFMLAPALYFNRDGKTVLFSLVQYDKTMNYSSRGGMVRKSVSASYYVQQNDAVTGARTAQQKIGHHSDIKYYPIETMGASGQLAWVFLGQVMAFDPFTLEKKADIALLEARNPFLKGLFPSERRFYELNTADGLLYFTASNGTKWQLNTTTLVAAASTYDPDKSPFDQALGQLEGLQQQNRAAQDSLYKQDNGASLYAQGRISVQEYQQQQSRLTNRRNELYRQRDSLQQSINLLRKQEFQLRHRQSAIRSLERPNPFYSKTKVNQDTLGGKWYGLYAADEWDELHKNVQWQSNHNETARGQLIRSTYTWSPNDDLVIEKEHSSLHSPSRYFLNGGFLVDKSTAMPIRLEAPAVYLVIHKDKIGQEGKILLSRVTTEGPVSWTFNTTLAAWTDWIYSGRQLFIFGVDNPELSSGQANVLWCVDLTTGKASRYDYFTDRQR